MAHPLDPFVPYHTHGPETRPHPAAVDEARNLAEVDPRDPPRTNELRIAQSAAVSSLQAETVALIVQSFTRGRGFLLGDSTGLGKGRVCAATILEGVMRAPGSKGLWVSTSMPLYKDAQRDVAALDPSGAHLEWGTNVRFTTYQLLARGIDEMVDWLTVGCAPATIVLDEVHAANGHETQAARGVTSLQARMPTAHVLYSTATAGTKISHLLCLSRLGLWGAGAPFESAEAFETHMRRFGCVGGELLMASLKMQGLYVSRQISMRGVDVAMHKCPLTAEQRRLYDECVRRWRVVGEPPPTQPVVPFGAPAAHLPPGVGTRRHRFFQGLLTAFKMPEAIRLARSGLERGCAVVFALQGTGEAQTKRAKVSSTGKAGEPLPHGPPSALRELMQQSGVAHADLALPLDPIDAVMEAFGAASVSELTGRTTRALPGTVWRWAGKPSLNSERDAFQTGERHVAVLSRAGSTGISLHAERPTSRPRMHLTVELPWSSETLVQQCGRSHRAGQTSLPSYYVLVTDVPAELRFVSTVAARLHALGALKHGDRNAAASQGSSELLHMHSTSGITRECIRRAACALQLVAAARAFPSERIDYGRVDHALLGQNADRLHRQTHTDRTALDLMRNLAASLKRGLGVPASDFRAVAATVATAVPAARFAALRAGRLDVRGRPQPACWTPATHWLFPDGFREAVRTVLKVAQCPEGMRTLGSLGPDILRIVVRRMSDGWPAASAATLKKVGRTKVATWGRMSVEEFLNEQLCSTLATQEHIVDVVGGCASTKDTAGDGGLMSLEQWVLPANACRGVEFSVAVRESRELVDDDELHVRVLVSATPAPPGQLGRWRADGSLVGVYYQLNGQLVAVVAAEGHLDSRQPGRPRRTHRLTAEQHEYAQDEHRQRARVARVQVRAYEPDDPTPDAAWESQAELCADRLQAEARRRSRVCVFVARNPLVTLDTETSRVLRVREIGFTGLLVRELRYDEWPDSYERALELKLEPTQADADDDDSGERAAKRACRAAAI